jgi:RimJ/RimL family protein N-acetyltransferase
MKALATRSSSRKLQEWRIACRKLCGMGNESSKKIRLAKSTLVGATITAPFDRLAERTDAAALAELMYDSYQDSVDYGGEDPEQAKREIEALMSGRYGAWLPRCSWVCAYSERLDSAALMVAQDESNVLLAYAMSRRNARRRHHASRLILASLRAGSAAGYENCILFVSGNNRPAMALYHRLGFRETEAMRLQARLVRRLWSTTPSLLGA